MVRTLIFISAIAICFTSKAQEKSYPAKNEIVFGATFSAGLQREKTWNLYANAYLGYFFHKNVSIRGDFYYFINSVGERPRFSMNHQILAGIFYNINTNIPLVPYVGVQPGIAISRGNEYGILNENTNEIEFPIGVNPIVSAVGGFTYYAPKIFHFFVETRYIFGKHTSTSSPIHLDEWRFSFGLGFNFNTTRKKK